MPIATIPPEPISVLDSSIEIAAGRTTGKVSVNKFGRTTNADSGVLTDIWDRANTTDDQDIWVAPTQARIHAIVSTSTGDDPGQQGAWTIRVYGLTAWDTAEVSEDITMDGTTPVNTVNSYVIIHRMKVLTKGTDNVNVGKITATAATDATVTAQINAAEGQTQMAIYGIPSTQTAYMTRYYASLNKEVKTAGANISLHVNPNPDVELTNFLIKHTKGLVSIGTGDNFNEFHPYFKVPGPAIIKLQVTTDVDNSDVDGGFDLILEDN